MPLDHVSLPTTPAHHARMRDFYAAVLAPLGYRVFKEQDGRFCGMHAPAACAGPDFWLHCGGSDALLAPADPSLSADENRKVLGARTHVAFRAGSRRAVDDWFRTAV